jgi:hypothetical protein
MKKILKYFTVQATGWQVIIKVTHGKLSIRFLPGSAFLKKGLVYLLVVDEIARLTK